MSDSYNPANATAPSYQSSFWAFGVVPGRVPPDVAPYCIVATFSGLAIYILLTLLIQIQTTFTTRKTLFYWSSLICVIGLIVQTIGFNWLRTFCPSSPKWLYELLGLLGWNLSMPSFSLVLYSRLHFVGVSPRTLSWVKWTIVATAVGFQVPYSVMVALVNFRGRPYLEKRDTVERIQQVFIAVQEIAISSLYIHNTARCYSSDPYAAPAVRNRMRRFVILLVLAQVFVIGCNAAMTALDFATLFGLRCMMHPFVTSLKLQIEFVTLNELKRLAVGGFWNSAASQDSDTTVQSGSDAENPEKKKKVEDLPAFLGSIPVHNSEASIASDKTRVASDATMCKTNSAETDKEMVAFRQRAEADDKTFEKLERRYLGSFSF